MKPIKYLNHSLKLFLLIFLGGFLSACSILPLATGSQGALQVVTGQDQSLSIYLDDQHLGNSPFFDEKIKTGEYTLKLTNPNNSQETIWQTRIKINRRTLTVVNFYPQEIKQESSSEILYLDKLSDKEATKLTISTLPDHLVVTIDGKSAGFSPLSVDDLAPGDHSILMEAPGYISKTIQVKLTPGHHLIIETELGRSSSLNLEPPLPTAPTPATESAAPSPSPATSDAQRSFGTTTSGISQGYADSDEAEVDLVEILPATPGINWLRVRETASGVANNEVARVQVGDFYPYVDDSENSEWREIEYAPDKTGFVASRYAKVIENN